MSKKLKKFLNDAEKTESKIAELEEYLRNVRAAQKKEESILAILMIRWRHMKFTRKLRNLMVGDWQSVLRVLCQARLMKFYQTMN